MIALPGCSHCRRAPCVCDVDAGDVRLVEELDDDLDVYAALRAAEAQDRAECWLRPYQPEDSR